MKCGLWKWLLEHPMDTANLPTNINYGFRRVWLKHNLDYKDWNSHAPREFPQNSTQAMSVGVMLVGGLGVLHGPSRFKRWGQTNIHAYTYIYIYIYIYFCLFMYYICICMYIYIYIYIYMYMNPIHAAVSHIIQEHGASRLQALSPWGRDISCILFKRNTCREKSGQMGEQFSIMLYDVSTGKIGGSTRADSCLRAPNPLHRRKPPISRPGDPHLLIARSS